MATTEFLLPWDSARRQQDFVCGEIALALGSKSPERLIQSAKSWLCHPVIDLAKPNLPWSTRQSGVAKVSPLHVSACYLSHLRSAWNFQFPEHPLERQEVLITVPASFGLEARDATVEAARLAGLPNIHLLEEPQAACYAWLWEHRNDSKHALATSNAILVIDIGGGTTDFSLLSNSPIGGQAHYKRVAVGDHILLGGDNIDFTLLHIVEKRLGLTSDRKWSSERTDILLQCRQAKEALLSDEGPHTFPISLAGKGTRLIAGSRSAELSREEVLNLVFQGFFPETGAMDFPESKSSAVVELGLPYAADPAFTKHIAKFLNQHQASLANSIKPGLSLLPDTVLLNGGIFASESICHRVQAILSNWSGLPVKLLTQNRPSTAIAVGAVAYLLGRNGLHSQLISSDAPRSYFLCLDSSKLHSGAKSVCLLPKGTTAGTEVILESQTYALQLGRPVSFEILATAEDTAYEVGQLIDTSTEQFSRLPPLIADLKQEGASDITEVLVKIATEMSELGDLHLYCISQAPPHTRWNLKFQSRVSAETNVSFHSESRIPSSKEKAAVELVLMAFGKKQKDVDGKLAKNLRCELERILGKREAWDATTLRSLAATAIDGSGFRRRTFHHERVWLNLVGYGLRPGFGFPEDKALLARLWPLYAHKLQYVNELQNWSEWWTLWRRVSAGLDQAAHVAILEDIRPFFDSSSRKKGYVSSLSKKRGYDDMLRLLGSLEYLPYSTKITVGEWVLSLLEQEPNFEIAWWTLGRIGARCPLYAGPQSVVPREVADSWLEKILVMNSKSQRMLLLTSANIGRMTEDAKRDVAPQLRAEIASRLKDFKAPASWLSMVTEAQELSATDTDQLLGDTLPQGLKLVTTDARGQGAT